VHNIVNQRLGKPVVSYDTAFAEWISGCDGNGPDDKFSDIKIRVGTLIIVGLIVVLIMKNR
jgi:hypothetical protein